MAAGSEKPRLPWALLLALLPLHITALETGTIPLLVSDDHADHLEFFYRHAGGVSGEPATMILLDAHSDTAVNENHDLARSRAASGDFAGAGAAAGNHNWIHPLCPAPLVSLVWINLMRGYPRTDKLEGFYRSVSRWNVPVKASTLTVEGLPFFEPDGQTLLVSVDLDFFYSADHRPEDVEPVLDALFSFSRRWQGRVIWALCLSRPWLPDDRYAWTLLERSLRWLGSRPEFARPQITLFNPPRYDTSRQAQAFRVTGREPPRLREAAAPEQVRLLLRELSER